MVPINLLDAELPQTFNLKKKKNKKKGQNLQSAMKHSMPEQSTHP